MSGRRLMTDFGPISLALFEIESGNGGDFPNANAADVLRLHGLMNMHDSFARKCFDDNTSNEKTNISSVLVNNNFEEALQNLTDVFIEIQPLLEKKLSSSLAVTLDFPPFGKFTIIAEAAEEEISFQLLISDRSASEWLRKELDALMQLLRFRLGKPVIITIHEAHDFAEQCNSLHVPVRSA